jgi:uncharacterized protein with GYD domain
MMSSYNQHVYIHALQKVKEKQKRQDLLKRQAEVVNLQHDLLQADVEWYDKLVIAVEVDDVSEHDAVSANTHEYAKTV